MPRQIFDSESQEYVDQPEVDQFLNEVDTIFKKYKMKLVPNDGMLEVRKYPEEEYRQFIHEINKVTNSYGLQLSAEGGMHIEEYDELNPDNPTSNVTSYINTDVPRDEMIF